MTEFVSRYKDFLAISFNALSFIIACTALFFSARTALRDRPKLLITARTVADPFYNQVYKIEVKVTNIGRRIAAIEGVQCHYEQGYTCRDYIKDGIHLKEKERTILDVERHRIIFNGDEGDVYQLEDITVLDTQGKEYKIKNSKKLVEKLIVKG